ncbi:MAG: hypothetical protein JXR65_11350 [Bacteroidales bacterium]|nr:hypothetical protein [Bacteroidales bacterium]
MRDILLIFPEKLSRWYWILLLFVLEFVFLWAFNGMFPFSIQKLKEISGSGIPDELYYYNYQQLHQVLKDYGATGRKMYLDLQWIDMIYPIVYSLLLGSLMALFYKHSRFVWLVLLPFFAIIFDYAENILLRIDVLNYPELNSFLVQMAAISTLLKWSLIMLTFIFLLIGIVAKIILIQSRRHQLSNL